MCHTYRVSGIKKNTKCFNFRETQSNTAYISREIQSRLPFGRFVSLTFKLKQGYLAPTAGLNGRSEPPTRDYMTYAAYLAHYVPNGTAR